MKASELRIGNLITDIDGDVFNIKQENLCDFANGFINVEPIPLTEEWLLKFGFTRHHADYSNGVIYIKNVPDNNEFEWGAYPNELGSGIQIKNRKLLKYVHQLQNLYFALTGEELTIK
jgi:hypothetical protein